MWSKGERCCSVKGNWWDTGRLRCCGVKGESVINDEG